MSDKNNIKIDAQNVNVFYADKQAIDNVSLKVEKSKITALIGPSGCGVLGREMGRESEGGRDMI